MRTNAKTVVSSSPFCTVCKEDREGRGGGGLCHRCYNRKWNGKPPSPEPLKRAPGTWKNVQAHVDLDVYEEMKRAAAKVRQSVPIWLNGAIQLRLKRGK